MDPIYTSNLFYLFILEFSFNVSVYALATAEFLSWFFFFMIV